MARPLVSYEQCTIHSKRYPRIVIADRIMLTRSHFDSLRYGGHTTSFITLGLGKFDSQNALVKEVFIAFNFE